VVVRLVNGIQDLFEGRGIRSLVRGYLRVEVIPRTMRGDKVEQHSLSCGSCAGVERLQSRI
jgi:hypothetical protein